MAADFPALPPRTPPDFALDAPDDATFAARGARIAAYLYANFPGLRGLQQHRPHFDPDRDRTTDPVEHTVEVLGNLDTRGLPPADAAILRVATIFHDVGKLRDPLNVRHAADSAELCPPYLEDFPLTPAGRADAIHIVKTHDVLGRLAQGRLTVAEACDLFGTRRLADLTARLTWADITSIRGLGRVLPSIDKARAAVFAAFDGGGEGG